MNKAWSELKFLIFKTKQIEENAPQLSEDIYH